MIGIPSWGKYNSQRGKYNSPPRGKVSLLIRGHGASLPLFLFPCKAHGQTAVVHRISFVYTPRVVPLCESCACTRVEFFEPAHVIPPREHRHRASRFFLPFRFGPTFVKLVAHIRSLVVTLVAATRFRFRNENRTGEGKGRRKKNGKEGKTGRYCTI